MEDSNTHIINKVFLEINTNSKEKGYYFKDNIDMFIKNELVPILENYFDTLDKENPLYSLQFENLKLEFSLNPDWNFSDFKEHFTKNILEQVDEQMEKETSNSQNYKPVHNAEKKSNAFFQFLETGMGVWWQTDNNPFELDDAIEFQKVINSKNFASQLITAFKNPIARLRFIKQFTNNQILMIMNATGLNIKDEVAISQNKNVENQLNSVQKIKETIEKNSSTLKLNLAQRNLVWDIALLLLLLDYTNDNSSENKIKQQLIYLIYTILESKYGISFEKKEALTVLKQIETQIENKTFLKIVFDLESEVGTVKEIVDNLNLKNRINDEKTENKTEEVVENIASIKEESKNESLSDLIASVKEELKTDEKQSHYYIKNAGLILVHPFLKQLFINCELIEKDNTLNNPDFAVHLLHYLATGKENEYEHTMIFEKFLCNVPLSEPIDRQITLSKKMKEEGDKMLEAVVANWEIMKKSSIQLLRNEFLQRPGKIIFIDGNPKVIIERKTQDIVLEKLNWNLSIVKLGWKKKIIYVEW